MHSMLYANYLSHGRKYVRKWNPSWNWGCVWIWSVLWKALHTPACLEGSLFFPTFFCLECFLNDMTTEGSTHHSQSVQNVDRPLKIEAKKKGIKPVKTVIWICTTCEFSFILEPDCTSKTLAVPSDWCSSVTQSHLLLKLLAVCLH